MQKLSALIAGVFAVILVLSPAECRADESDVRAGKIRSALIYYLVKFVSFPPTEEHSQGPIKICLFGKDPINDFLPDIVANKTAQGRALEVVKRSESLSPKELLDCEVNFFGADIGDAGLRALKAKETGILSVCSVVKVSWGSCMIQIFEEDNKAKLAVDLELLQAASLKVSSELIEVSLVNKSPPSN